MNIQQIDIAPLMSYLIGVPIPINSLVDFLKYFAHLGFKLFHVWLCFKMLKGENSFGIIGHGWKREKSGFQNECTANCWTTKGLTYI